MKKKIHLTLVLFLFCISTCPFPSNAQQNELPMRFQRESESPIMISGGNAGFALRCFQSELGKGSENDVDLGAFSSDASVYLTVHEWKNIKKREWGTDACTFRLSYCYNHPDFDVFTDSLNCMLIECFDSKGNDLLATDIKKRAEIMEFIKQKLFDNWLVVNSSNGVVVRQEPSVNSAKIYQYRDESKVVVLGKTSEETEIISGEKTIRSKWVEVFVRLGVTGYIAEAYLLPWYEIHPRQLKQVNFISFADSVTGKQFSYSTLPTVRNYETGNQEPNPYYSKFWKDSLKRFIKWEEVSLSDYENKKVNNPYRIDTSYADSPTPKTSGGTYPPGNFYLKINNNKDTLWVKERPREYPESRSYIGKIPLFNHYVFRAYSFGGYYTFYDAQTGFTDKYHFCGIPYFSPDGLYAVSFTETVDPEIMDWAHTCLLTISHMDSKYKVKSTFTVDFACFLPDESPDSAFWISERELILKVQTTDAQNYPFAAYKSNILTDKLRYRYVKLTIL